MTTGSWCLTEILISRNPCSSNSEHSHSADSTNASGVALPCLDSSRGSSEPAFTPIRIGTPASPAALAISATLSSNCLMLPGFTRTAAQPASIAANTYLGWKWMSAMTGICDCCAITGSASASSWLGTATRTIWQPDAVSSAICCRVALMSAVTVVVMDCTDTGASPPTGTLPTLISRDFRRSASGLVGGAGIPRLTDIGRESTSSGRELDRVDQVGRREERGKRDEQHHEHVRDRDRLARVDVAGIGSAQQPVDQRAAALEQQQEDVAAVQRRQRQQVEDADEDV